MRALLKILLILQILLALPCSVYGLRLYSHAEYNAARERAVQTARGGDLKSAILSLERLLKLEPDNHGAFNDYLTVLIWDEQYNKALHESQFLNLKETPEYVLRSLISAADKEQKIRILNRLIKVYINKYPVIPTDTPANIAGKSFQEIAELAASAGMNQTSLSILKTLHKKHPDNQAILADYIHALNTNKQHQKALALLPLVAIEEAPEFEIDALITSSEKLGEKELHKKLLAKVSQPANEVPAETEALPTTVIKIQSPIRIAAKLDGVVKRCNTSIRHSGLDTGSRGYSKLKIPDQVWNDSAGAFYKLVKLKQNNKLSDQSSEKKIIAAARKHLKKHEFEKAHKLLYPLYIKGNRSEALLNTAALYYTSQNDYARAAYIYLQLYELNPENSTAKRYMILNLFYAGAPFKALEWLQTDPNLLSQTETDKINTDSKAFTLRWSGYTLPKKVKQADLVNEILVQLQQELSEREPQGYDYNLSRLQMDYIVALHNRGLTQEVLNRYALLYSESYTFPDYVLYNIAASYLDTRQPEEAREFYLNLLQRSPNSYPLHEGLFWAYFDNGQFQKGLEVAAKLDAATPVWRKDHSGTIVKENNEKLQTSLLVAMGAAYSDDLAGAQKKLEEMSTTAPYNTEILYNLASLYRWRGWPQKSYDTISIATTFEPDPVSLKIAKAYALFEMYHFSQAETIWDELANEDPDNKVLKRFGKEWKRWHKRQFLLWSDGGNSDSDYSNYGSSDFTIESMLYDKLYKSGLRPFLHQYYTTADFTEGTGRYERMGMGTEYKRNRNKISAEMSGSYAGNSDIGISLQSEHDITDHIEFTFGYDSFSTNIPVRAYYHGIKGQGYKAGAQYRLHESTKFSASYEFLDFSDTNRRNSWSLLAQQRLLTMPRVKIDLIPSVYHSTNSRIGASYFNPEEDTSYSLAITTDWLTYYHYNTKFSQNLELVFGRYDQKNYDTESTYALVYQHKWDITKELNITYGLKWSSNYYDGDKENRLAGFASLGWLF